MEESRDIVTLKIKVITDYGEYEREVLTDDENSYWNEVNDPTIPFIVTGGMLIKKGDVRTVEILK